jgi:hypothetical protein
MTGLRRFLKTKKALSTTHLRLKYLGLKRSQALRINLAKLLVKYLTQKMEAI